VATTLDAPVVEDVAADVGPVAVVADDAVVVAVVAVAVGDGDEPV
jgi:hypothetical protein